MQYHDKCKSMISFKRFVISVRTNLRTNPDYRVVADLIVFSMMNGWRDKTAESLRHFIENEQSIVKINDSLKESIDIAESDYNWLIQKLDEQLQKVKQPEVEDLERMIIFTIESLVFKYEM